jgi:acyl-CoA thioesterase I
MLFFEFIAIRIWKSNLLLNLNFYILKTIYLPCLILLIWLCACGDKNTPVDQKIPPKDSLVPLLISDTLKQIVFFGNSITAGYGLDPSACFTSLIQKRIDSLKIPFRVVNAGLSGETSAGGASRIDWVLHQRVDIFVLELGGNDGLRGISMQETAQNLQAIIDKVRQKSPTIKLVIAGMEIPPNLGISYAKDFHDLFPRLANKNGAYLIPFLLEGVGGVDSLNQRDGIHPNEKGERIVEENAWHVLKGIL